MLQTVFIAACSALLAIIILSIFSIKLKIKNRYYGKSQYKYENGDIYIGRWRNRQRHGKGIMSYSNGEKYEGYWENDCRHGKGIMSYSNGDKYDGHWEKDCRHGEGTMSYANGDTYEGHWKNDCRHGKGTMRYTEMGTYRGEWEDDDRNGKGKMTWLDGHYYEGDWKHDTHWGRGVLSWPNKEKYDGFWKEGKYHWKGMLTYPDGAKEYGVWKNGVLFEGKTIPCRQEKGELEYFCKKGTLTSTSEHKIEMTEFCIFKKTFFMRKYHVPYRNYYITIHEICERKFLNSDTSELLVDIGKDNGIYNYVENVKSLYKLYTDASINSVLSNYPRIYQIVKNSSNEDGIPYLRRYNNDCCICWKSQISEAKSYSFYAKSTFNSDATIYTQFAQDFLFELEQMKIDSKFLVIDEDKERSLQTKQKIKGIVGKVIKFTAKVALKVGVFAVGAYIGADIADGDFDFDFDSDLGLDGDLGIDPDAAFALYEGNEISLDSDSRLALPVDTNEGYSELEDVINTQLEYDTEANATSTFYDNVCNRIDQQIENIESQMENMGMESGIYVDGVNSQNYASSSVGSTEVDTSYIDRLYDHRIEDAQEKLVEDTERLAKDGPYAWENANHTIDSDRRSIEYWKENKEQAIAKAKINQAKQDYWNSVSEYCKERMSKKIGE